MTLPNMDIKKVIGFLQFLHGSPRYMSYDQLARDVGISYSRIYNIINFGDPPRPGGKVERKMFDYIERVKIEYDKFCPQEVNQK